MATSLATAAAFVDLKMNDTPFRESLKNIHGKMKPTLIAAEELGTILTKVGATSAAVFSSGAAAITGFVKAAAPWEIERMGYAVRDLAAVIGQPLIPYFRMATQYVRQFADWIFNLDPATKKWASNLLATATAVGAVGAALLPVGMAITTATSIVAKSMAVLASPLLIPLAEILAIGGGLTYLFSQTAVGAEALSKVTQTLGLAFEYVKASIREAVSQMVPSFELMKKAFTDLAPVLGGLTKLFQVAVVGGLAIFQAGLDAMVMTVTTLSSAFAFLAEQVQRAVAALEAFKEWRDAGSPQGWKGLGKAIRMKQEAFTAAKERASMVTGGDFGDEMGAAKKSSMGQGFFGDPAYQGLEEARKAFQIEALKIPEEEKKDEAAERLLTTNEILELIKNDIREIREKPGLLGA